MDWGLAAIGGILGAVFGSFAATAALRMSEGRDPIRGRSVCDGCARELKWLETVPVAGGIIAKGRCTTCQHSIDRFHLLGEVLGGAILAISLGALRLPHGALIGALGLLLLMQALIDLKTYRLPDIGNVLIAALCLVLAWTQDRVVEGLIAASVTWALLTGLRHVMKRKHGQDMLGGGDIKLMTALAIGLGTLTPWMIAGAAGATLFWTVATRSKPVQGRLPFGPGIAVIGLVVMFWWAGASYP